MQQPHPVPDTSPSFFQILDDALKLLSPGPSRAGAGVTGERAELTKAELLEKTIELHIGRGPAHLKYGRAHPAHACEVSEAFVEESRKLGFIDAVLPSEEVYEYAVIDGNMLPIMSLSANYLAHLCRQHQVTVKQIIMLGTKRKAAIHGCGNDGLTPWDLPIDLSPFEEAMFHPEIKVQVMEAVEADTEYSLACQLKEELASKGPEHMKNLWREAKVVNADHESANTIATVQNWLDQKPEPGSVLYVSMQPFLMSLRTGLQKWLAHTDFKDQTLDVVGPGLTEKVRSKEFGLVLLDQIGAWAHVTQYDPEYMPPREVPTSEASFWSDAFDSEAETDPPIDCGRSDLSADRKRVMLANHVNTCKPAVEIVQKVFSLPTSTGTNSEV